MSQGSGLNIGRPYSYHETEPTRQNSQVESASAEKLRDEFKALQSRLTRLGIFSVGKPISVELFVGDEDILAYPCTQVQRSKYMFVGGDGCDPTGVGYCTLFHDREKGTVVSGLYSEKCYAYLGSINHVAGLSEKLLMPMPDEGEPFNHVSIEDFDQFGESVISASPNDLYVLENKVLVSLEAVTVELENVVGSSVSEEV